MLLVVFFFAHVLYQVNLLLLLKKNLSERLDVDAVNVHAGNVLYDRLSLILKLHIYRSSWFGAFSVFTLFVWSF